MMSKDSDKKAVERRVAVRRTKTPAPFTGVERRKYERREDWSETPES